MSADDRPLRRAARSLRLDLKFGWHALVRNTVASSALTPRLVRAVLYRAAGYRFETANLAEGIVLNNGNVRIGRDSSVSRACFFEGQGLTTIGADCMIGQEVAFITGNHGVDSAGVVDRVPTYLPITVGRRTWIGARATVLGGSAIGDGVIVTAGSVVSGVCDSGFVYSGVPARKIGRVKALGRMAASPPAAAEPAVQG